MNCKILFITFLILCPMAFADDSTPNGSGTFAKDSSKLNPSTYNNGISIVQGTVADWINTGGTGTTCEGKTQLIDTKDFSQGSAIPACPQGSKGQLSFSARQQFYLPTDNDAYNNGWRADAGDIPLCVNSDNNYTLNVCAYTGYNGGGRVCGPIYMEYTVTCVPQSNTSYTDPKCPVAQDSDKCYFSSTDMPQPYPTSSSGAPLPYLPK